MTLLPVDEPPLAAAVALLPDSPDVPAALALLCASELCPGILTLEEPATTLAVVTAVG